MSMRQATGECRRGGLLPFGLARRPRLWVSQRRRCRTMKHFIAPGVEASRSAIGTRSARRWMKPRRVSRVDGIDRWLAKIAETLSLDRLETEILSLALQYHLDLRIGRLFDHLSDCRGRPTRLQRDAALIALLLQGIGGCGRFAAGTGCKAAGERAAACGAAWGIASVGAAHGLNAPRHTTGSRPV